MFLENDTSFNSTYFTEYVFNDIEHLPALQNALQLKKKFVLHMDNSSIHKSLAITEKVASLHLALATHPPYSSDLISSEFFLFEYLKEKMIGIDLESPHELIDWIQSTFEAITRHVLNNIFEIWLRRVQNCINSKGSYIKAE
jgi:transposase